MNINDHALFKSGRVKVYFVELDDDNRERVISGVIDTCYLKQEQDYEDIHTGFGDVFALQKPATATLEARFVEQDGVLFKHEIWEEEE